MSQSDYEVLAAFTDKRIDKNIVIPPHVWPALGWTQNSAVSCVQPFPGRDN